MQDQATETQTFAMRRDTSGLLVAFDEWQALRGAWAGLPARLVPDIPCPPEDIFPDDHGAVWHIDLVETSIS